MRVLGVGHYNDLASMYRGFVARGHESEYLWKIQPIRICTVASFM